MRPGEIIHNLRIFLKGTPLFFLPMAALREDVQKRRVRKSTELVIEGPPRSGNHYATYAFLNAQDPRVDVAHHFHAPAQIMLASRWGIPAVALIRRPDNMAASYLLYMHGKGFDWLTPELCARLYVSFYESIWPLRASFEVGLFESFTVQGMSAVIERINTRFDRSFAYFRSLEEERGAAFEASAKEHARNPRLQGKWWTDPSPNKRKEEAKAYFRSMVKESEADGVFDDAWKFYREFRALADQDSSAAEAVP